MLAVAAERTPRRWVDDYWKRLGTTPDDRRPGVFLSYAHADVREARELKTALGPEVLVVLDADYLRLGETWWDIIGDAITHCALTLVLVSPAAVASMNVEDEISAAVHERNKTRGRHRLVPVILVAVERMPMPLQGKNGLYVEREGGIQPVAQKLKAELTVSGLLRALQLAQLAEVGSARVLLCHVGTDPFANLLVERHLGREPVVDGFVQRDAMHERARPEHVCVVEEATVRAPPVAQAHRPLRQPQDGAGREVVFGKHRPPPK